MSRIRPPAVLLLALLAACGPPTGAGPVAAPRDRDLPRVEPPTSRGALTAVSPAVLPGLAAALAEDRESLLEALDHSLAWFAKESSRTRFTTGEISYERARASVYAFRQLASEKADATALARRIRAEFVFYRSSGGDGRGTVLFTGYYTPAFRASLTPSDEFPYPLYRRPDDLVVDEMTGEVKGRRVGERVLTYPTRADIEKSGVLAGTELAWLRDRFEAYLVHLQGSAALLLPDGTTLNVAYAGNNGHDYVSVARQLVADGKLREDQLGLEGVRSYFKANPEDLEPYLHRNPRFVFFREGDSSAWPVGSLGSPVTPLRTLAADKSVFPPGGVVLVVTEVAGRRGRREKLVQFMLDQDSGGAIRSPGRADIYFGVGPEAEARAGGQYAEGQLYYLFLKPERVEGWLGAWDQGW